MIGPEPTAESDMTRCATCDGSGFVRGELVPKARYDLMKKNLEGDLAAARHRLGSRPTWWERNNIWVFAVVFLGTVGTVVGLKVADKYQQFHVSAEERRAQAAACLRNSGPTRCLCLKAEGFNEETLQCYISLASSTEAHKPPTEKTP